MFVVSCALQHSPAFQKQNKNDDAFFVQSNDV